MIKRSFIFLILIGCLFFSTVSLVMAETGVSAEGESAPGTSEEGVSEQGTGGSGGQVSVRLDDPMKLKGDPSELFARIIKAILGVVGSLAFLVFIVGGVTWLTSSGKAEKVKLGRDMFIYAALGLIIVFSSYVILNFIFKAITS